ncbi:MAG: PKD domain-containing protein [Planctomycetes bacterium]|nr:PKD domain-containing protein [Planctomycetota bacterium]
MPLVRQVAWLCALFAAGACKDSRRSPSPSLQIPAFDVTVTADRPTGVPGTTFTFTATSSAGATPIRYDWQLPDGSLATGPAVEFVPTATGSLITTVIATDARGRRVESEVLATVFPPAGRPATGLLDVPRAALPGDANNNGALELVDALRCARVANRTEPVADAAEVLRLDADLDGRLSKGDLDFVAGALDGTATVPTSLLPARGAPGRVVRVQAPILLDPATTVRVRIGGSAPFLLDRVELGFGAFVVPLDLPAGPTTVALEADGTAVTEFEFDVLPSYVATAAPGALFGQLDALASALRPQARIGLEQSIGAAGLSAEQRQLLTTLWDTGFAQAAAAEAEVRAIMATLPPDAIALLEQIAVANGLLEQLAEGQELAGIAAEASPLVLSDDQLGALCTFAAYKTTIVGTAFSWASTACTWGGTAAAIALATLAAIGSTTVVVPAGVVATLTALVSACVGASVPLAVNEVVAEIAPDMKLARLALTASPEVLDPPQVDSSELRISLTVPVDPSLCRGGSKLSELVAKKAIEKVLGKAPLVGNVVRLIKLLPKKVKEQLLGPIVDLIAAGVGRALDESGIAAELDAVGQFLCQLGTVFGATIDPNGVLTGPDPAVGTLQLAAAGTEDPSIYTGDPTQRTSVTFRASKMICGETLEARATVSYGVRPVTITMGDNGSALDDIYAVEIEGQTVLTSSAPVVQISTTVELTLGDHVVIMRGLAAPDGIGTYYIQFAGASVLPGSSALSGTNLIPGTIKTYNIRVQ